MKQKETQKWILTAMIGAAIVIISALHFLTPLASLTAHQIYQRLYYLPIIAAALFFGWRGGAAAAIFATAAYLPHIIFQWHHHRPEYALNQYAEIILFFAFGSIAGFLSDRNRREHERAERSNQELERSYAELRGTFEQLLQAERLAAMGELSAGIVHEIRNPLAAIKGAVEILEDELAPDSPRREFARIAKTEVERLNKLVEEFVNFARAPKPIKTSQDICQIIKAVTALLEPTAAMQGVLIKMEAGENLPHVPVDGEQIKQVLLNLAVNALQAMPDGGEIRFRASERASEIVVEVEDTGGGIPSAVVNRLFDPFFTTKEKGLGLGLSIAHKIVRQHGGNLAGKNSLSGAVFSLSLPTTAVETL